MKQLSVQRYLIWFKKNSLEGKMARQGIVAQQSFLLRLNVLIAGVGTAPRFGIRREVIEKKYMNAKIVQRKM